MTIGMLDQEYNEARKIAQQYADGIEYEDCMKQVKVNKPASDVTKKYVGMAFIHARHGDEKIFKQISNRLLGDGKAKLQIELKQNRTTKRGT
jgi:hypothetical protein